MPWSSLSCSQPPQWHVCQPPYHSVSVCLGKCWTLRGNVINVNVWFLTVSWGCVSPFRILSSKFCSLCQRSSLYLFEEWDPEKKKNFVSLASLLNLLWFLRNLVVHVEKRNKFLCRLVWMKTLQSHFFSLGAYRTGTSQFNSWSKTDNNQYRTTIYQQPWFGPQNSAFSSLSTSL